MPQYVMALDAGTTSSRCILFDRRGKICSVAQKEFSQIYPRPGWVEHDAGEIWSTQLGVAAEAMARVGAKAADIAAIGITNQRETTLVWDRKTGEPLCNAIVWQCRRTSEYCDSLRAKGLADSWRQKTGLVIDAYFSGTKLRWILENVPGARERAEKGELLFGTVDTWLIWKLTEGQVHVTDYSNASRTLMYNIRRLDWDDEILAELQVPRCMLPQVKSSSEVYGATAPSVFGAPIPIAGAAGDQQAALFGQTCWSAGEAKNTYGTGCFMLMNLGHEATLSQNGLVTTIGIAQGGEVDYALEGSVFQAGSVIQWLRDGLGLIETAAETGQIASSVPDTGGCYLVPAFTGLGAPWWSPDARGVVCGITRGTDRARLVRAACESMAYQTYDILKAMEADSGHRLTSLNVDGGAANNEFIMQFQSDLLDIGVVRAGVDETTALGAAYLAGLAVGFWDGREELASMQAQARRYEPQMSAVQREALLAGWRAAVRRTLA